MPFVSNNACVRQETVFLFAVRERFRTKGAVERHIRAKKEQRKLITLRSYVHALRTFIMKLSPFEVTRPFIPNNLNPNKTIHGLLLFMFIFI